jgi:hypothetical protein
LDDADDQTDEAIFLVRRKYPETNQCSNQPKAWPAMTLTARRIPMKHLILSAITAVTLLVAATTMLWSHSLFTERQAVAMVIGQIQQIESPLQNTVEGMVKAFWFSRLCLAARAADLDTFGQGLILRDSSGWQIRPAGRTFLDWLESGAASANVPRGQAFAAPTRATATAAGRCAATTMADETWTPKTAFCLRFGRCGYGAAFFWRVDRLQARQPERGCPCPRSQPAAIQTFGLNAGMSFPAVPAWSWSRSNHHQMRGSPKQQTTTGRLGHFSRSLTVGTPTADRASDVIKPVVRPRTIQISKTAPMKTSRNRHMVARFARSNGVG